METIFLRELSQNRPHIVHSGRQPLQRQPHSGPFHREQSYPAYRLKYGASRNSGCHPASDQKPPDPVHEKEKSPGRLLPFFAQGYSQGL